MSQLTGSFNRACLYCTRHFEAAPERRLFCADGCRVRYNRELSFCCFYCGEFANTRDHVTPHAATTSANVRTFRWKETVNACLECNAIMGDNFPSDIVSRIGYLIERLQKRYSLDIKRPEWSDKELDELGYKLRATIQGKIQQRRRAIERVAHAQGVMHRVSEIIDRGDNIDELIESSAASNTNNQRLAAVA